VARCLPAASWNDRTFTGDLYETNGHAYFGATFDPRQGVEEGRHRSDRFDSEELRPVFSYRSAPASPATSDRAPAFGPP
jgi:hypothetical protein